MVDQYITKFDTRHVGDAAVTTSNVIADKAFS
jgi:hypothetical protein